MSKALVILFLVFSSLSLAAKEVTIPDGFVVPIYFDRTLDIDAIDTSGSTTVQPVHDIEIDGVKVFSSESQGFAKVSYKKMNVFLYAQTSLGGPTVTIPELTIYDTFNHPHRFLLSKDQNKFKEVKFRAQVKSFFISKIPGTYRKNLISRSKVFYAFHQGTEKIVVSQ